MVSCVAEKEVNTLDKEHHNHEANYCDLVAVSSYEEDYIVVHIRNSEADNSRDPANIGRN
jgi:hypothetical protein